MTHQNTEWEQNFRVSVCFRSYSLINVLLFFLFCLHHVFFSFDGNIRFISTQNSLKIVRQRYLTKWIRRLVGRYFWVKSSGGCRFNPYNKNYNRYIYTYRHPQTDCFVVSQLFSVARHVRRLKLGLKPAQLYVRLSIILLSQQANHVS